MSEPNYDELFFSTTDNKLSDAYVKILELESDIEEVIRVLWKVSPEHREWIKAKWKNISKKIEKSS